MSLSVMNVIMRNAGRVALLALVGAQLVACGSVVSSGPTGTLSGSSYCSDLKKQCDACTGYAGKVAGQANCNKDYGLYTSSSATGTNGEGSCKQALDSKLYAADGLNCK